MEYARAVPAPQSVGDAARIPCEVYQMMHLPGSAENERCGPCEGAVQEIEFGDETAEGVIS